MRMKFMTVSMVCAAGAFMANAALIHQHDASKAPGIYNFADGVASVSFYARDTAGNSSGDGAIVNATTAKTKLTKAFTVTTTDTGYARVPLANATYTFEIWTRLPGGTDPGVNSVIFESGGGTNGFGIFTVNGALEFATYSGSGANSNVVSLATTTLDTTDYLQVAAVYNTSNNQITFQVKDVNGITVSDTASSGTLGTGTGNMAGLFLPALTTTQMSQSTSNAGGVFASSVPNSIDISPYAGEIALFNIYDNDAIASGDVGTSYLAVIPEPATLGLFIVSAIGVLGARRLLAH